MCIIITFCPHCNAVTVRSISGAEQFRGVLLQARLVADDTTPVGSFTATDPNTRLSSCTPPEVSKETIMHVQA